MANLRPCLIRNKGLPGVALSPVKRPASLKLYNNARHCTECQKNGQKEVPSTGIHLRSAVQRSSRKFGGREGGAATLKRAIYILSWIRPAPLLSSLSHTPAHLMCECVKRVMANGHLCDPSRGWAQTSGELYFRINARLDFNK